jgi:hypothetical protein
LKSAAAVVARGASDFGPWHEILEHRIPNGPLKIEAVDVWKLVGIEGAETINRLTKAHHTHLKAAMAGLRYILTAFNPPLGQRNTNRWFDRSSDRILMKTYACRLRQPFAAYVLDHDFRRLQVSPHAKPTAIC